MKMGSKGVEPATIIAIIGGVIVMILLIYVLYSRGMIPFLPLADKTICIGEILDACGGARDWNNVNKNCGRSFKDIRENCGGCIGLDPNIGCDHEKCCEWARLERLRQ
ncbi:MAG: hypothetical protein QXG39_03735 [Candidatus Aenigmatarchaeota archaeon]